MLKKFKMWHIRYVSHLTLYLWKVQFYQFLPTPFSVKLGHDLQKKHRKTAYFLSVSAWWFWILWTNYIQGKMIREMQTLCTGC